MHSSVELRISPPTFVLRMRTDISRLQMVGIQRVFLCIFGLHPTRVPVCCPLACLNLLLLHCAIRYHACVYHGPCPLCPSCVHLSAGCAFRALSAETWPLYPHVRLEPRPSSPLGLDYMTQPPPLLVEVLGLLRADLSLPWTSFRVDSLCRASWVRMGTPPSSSLLVEGSLSLSPPRGCASSLVPRRRFHHPFA
jgi:hypothetical protein